MKHLILPCIKGAQSCINLELSTLTDENSGIEFCLSQTKFPRQVEVLTSVSTDVFLWVEKHPVNGRRFHEHEQNAPSIHGGRSY